MRSNFRARLAVAGSLGLAFSNGCGADGSPADPNPQGDVPVGGANMAMAAGGASGFAASGQAGLAGAAGLGPATGGAATGGTGLGGAGAQGPGGEASLCSPPSTGHYQMEDLDRGVVALEAAGGIYVGWRMLGYEYDGVAANVAYKLFRDGVELATVTDSTNYLDAAGTPTSSYSVSAIIRGTECARSAETKPWAGEYLSIPLSPPPNGPHGGSYSANDASVGDLDGDGQLDLVLKWDPSNAKDNSQEGVTDDVFLDGYTLAGQRLFRINLGPNIRAGAHYTQFSVYDFDGDGKAEIACKTAPGSKDGTGQFLSLGPAASDDDAALYRNGDGYVLTGPEYLSVFDGTTGKELATVDYPVARGNVSSWGDSYGNRVDRFNGGVAFVSDTGEGKAASGRPSIIQSRGYYTRLTVAAYDYRDGQLSPNWVYDSKTSLAADGAGAHSQMAGDADGDGAQEIFTGAATISSDGKLQCHTGLGHGDALHVGELIVGKPMAIFTVHEGAGGYDVHDAATCETYVKVTGGADNGRGVADYVETSNSKAAVFWSATSPDRYSAADGMSLGKKPGPTNFLIYWDADDARELEDGTTISKLAANGAVSTLLNCDACASNNSTKSTPALTADLFGDHREEIVWRQADNRALRVYTTTALSKRRIYTLMHDPTYRAQVSFQQSAYNQPPHVGFHIGPGMADPPVPDIRVAPRQR